MEQQVCGVNIHYELAGNGEKRVVLLHGWGCDVKLMKPLSDFLSRDMTVLSVDFPGHGQSGKPPEPWGVPDFARCVLTLLRELEFLPCSVIAHSFGGRVTIDLAAEDASLFERIILTGAAGIKKAPSAESQKRTARYKRLKGIVNALRPLKIFGKLPDALEEKLRQRYGSKDYNALDAEMRKTFVKVVGYDQTHLLERIQQPTLLLWGDKDTETPLWMGQMMEKRIPDAGLVVLEGGSHFAYLEQAARFHAIAHNFLME